MIPGVITVAALAIYSSITGIRQKMPRTKFDRREALSSLWEAKWEAALPVGLLGGMYTGLLRIHEAAAFTAIYTLIIEVFIYRDVSFRKDLPRIIREAMTLVGAILVILATAIGFTAFLIQARVPMMILDSMEGFITSQLAFLIALNVFLIGVGMLMDIFSAIVVVVPLIVPIAERFGVDPYHLGIVFLLNLEIGYMTPPVGLNLFISSFRFNKPITQLYTSVLPFIALLGTALIIVTYIPTLSTWLPGLIDDNVVTLDEPIGDEEDFDGLDLDALEEGGDDFDLDDLELDDEELDLDALEEEATDEELDLDALEEDAADEEQDLDALEGDPGEQPAQ